MYIGSRKPTKITFIQNNKLGTKLDWENDIIYFPVASIFKTDLKGVFHFIC